MIEKLKLTQKEHDIVRYPNITNPIETKAKGVIKNSVEHMISKLTQEMVTMKKG